ncbi:MAG: Eco57I restriction-modification methylase domain-containing protein [Syntrophales bacterium]|nr:Eco57I restriction-modification methylase domain-containing protein [Syntrophales bacterium]
MFDEVRQYFNSSTSRAARARIGQFLTPASIARFMSSMFEGRWRKVRILDPGAGAGALFSSCVEYLVSRKERPNSIEIVAYETDANIIPYLEKSIRWCESLCTSAGTSFHGEIKVKDFISSAITETEENLYSVPVELFSHIIINPPYKKINGQTPMSKMLHSAGIEVANLYAAFVWLSMRLLETGGQMVAITPRSFCNGPYFRKFRIELLKTTSLRHIHVFMSRKKPFGDDNVLQENVIYRVIRKSQKPKFVTISSTEGVDFSRLLSVRIPYSHVVHPDDKDAFIHLGIETNLDLKNMMERFTASLGDLDLEVSTGRIVDFRAKDYLRKSPRRGTVPLIYPCHFQNGFIKWPVESGKKSNAIVSTDETFNLFVEAGYYVLTKRFSSKEQRKRVMAAVYDPARTNTSHVGFENHLNYFHRKGKGLHSDIAKGLALYLNSSIVDRFFRIFSGHTQVNATDLRKIPYPTYEQLVRLGSYVDEKMPEQDTIDALVEKECCCE